MENDNHETPTPAAPVATTETSQPSSFVFNEQTIMASLSYVGPLVLIPFLTKKEDPFVSFHIKQGLVLFVPSLIIYVLGYTMVFYRLWPIFSLVNLVVIGLSILGIIYALQLKQTDIPLVGQLAKRIQF